MQATGLAERLRAQQDGIVAILDEAEAMLRDETTRDIAGLARARWALMRALTAHDLLKQGEVLNPAIERGGTEGARAARVKQASADAVDAFRGNVTKWSAADVSAVWASYQPSALAMIARLREHLARERQELAILLRSAPTPPPAGAPPRPGRPTPGG